MGKNRELYLENYWLKNKRPVDKGKNGPVYAWVIPAAQRRKADAADAVNELRRQGLEIHTATAAFKAGTLDVTAGDYVIRADQPYRTLADMYFSLQNYAPPIRHPTTTPAGPSSYAEPGDHAVHRQERLDQKITPLPPTRAPGGIREPAPVLVASTPATTTW